MRILCSLLIPGTLCVRRTSRTPVVAVDLNDLTHSLMDGNEFLFTNVKKSSPDVDLATLDLKARRTDLPAMCGIPTISGGENAWDWIMSSFMDPKLTPYPMLTSDFLNRYFYARMVDPSDSFSLMVAGDVVIQPDWNTEGVTWKTWPDIGLIHYTLDMPQGYKDSACIRRLVSEAAARWKEATNACVNFEEVESSSATPNTLHIGVIENNGCHTSLGFNPSNNVMNIGTGCRNVGTIMHLLGHILGLAHVDQRPDAANFVRVNNTNINVYGMASSSQIDPTTTQKYKYVFTPLNGTQSKWEEVIEYFPYEYGSLMHNSRYMYSVDTYSDPTINLVKPGSFEELLGNRGYITEQDARLVNEMYKCDRLPVMLIDRSFKSPLTPDATYEVRLLSISVFHSSFCRISINACPWTS